MIRGRTKRHDCMLHSGCMRVMQGRGCCRHTCNTRNVGGPACMLPHVLGTWLTWLARYTTDALKAATIVSSNSRKLHLQSALQALAAKHRLTAP